MVRKKQKEKEPDRAEFAGSLQQAAALLRSGAPADVAWSAVLGQEYANADPGSRLSAWAEDHPHYRSSAILPGIEHLTRSTGTPAADLLDSLARGEEQEEEAAGAWEAAISGPAATSSILTWLPVLGLLLGTVLGAAPISALVDGALGTASAVAGMVLLALGRLWSARMLRAAKKKSAAGDTMTVEMLGAVLRSGASIPTALEQVGSASPTDLAGLFRRTGESLLAEPEWPRDLGRSLPGRLTEPDRLLFLAVTEQLRLAWETGMPAAGLLEAISRRMQNASLRSAQRQAGALGVRLVLPLGVCFLPAFMLLSVVPTLLSMFSQLQL